MGNDKGLAMADRVGEVATLDALWALVHSLLVGTSALVGICAPLLAAADGHFAASVDYRAALASSIASAVAVCATAERRREVRRRSNQRLPLLL